MSADQFPKMAYAPALSEAPAAVPHISPIVLGCNRLGAQLDPAMSERILGEAADCGVTTFDTAQHYAEGASEEIVGKFIRKSRANFLVSTKFGYNSRGSSPAVPDPKSGSQSYIRASLEASLRRLGTDYVDLYNYHVIDAATPIEETLGVLNDMVKEGKIRALGGCSFPAWRYIDAQWCARAHGLRGFSYVHYEYNLINRRIEKDVLPAIVRGGSSIVAFFPLAAGLLTGKYRSRDELPPGSRFSQNSLHRQQFLTDGNLDLAMALQEMASEIGRSLQDVSLNWLATQSSVAGMVCGVSSLGQIRESVAALAKPLSEDELGAVAKAIVTPDAR